MREIQDGFLVVFVSYLVMTVTIMLIIPANGGYYLIVGVILLIFGYILQRFWNNHLKGK